MPSSARLQWYRLPPETHTALRLRVFVQAAVADDPAHPPARPPGPLAKVPRPRHPLRQRRRHPRDLVPGRPGGPGADAPQPPLRPPPGRAQRLPSRGELTSQHPCAACPPDAPPSVGDSEAGASWGDAPYEYNDPHAPFRRSTLAISGREGIPKGGDRMHGRCDVHLPPSRRKIRLGGCGLERESSAFAHLKTFFPEIIATEASR